MKLDRDVNHDGLAKYALINLRKLNGASGHSGPFNRWTPEVADALRILEEAGALEWGKTGAHDEFFPIKLKDENAAYALTAYASAAARKDPEFGAAVNELAQRAGQNSPFCKSPD